MGSPTSLEVLVPGIAAESPCLPHGWADGLSSDLRAACRLLVMCRGNVAFVARLLLPKHLVQSPCAPSKPSGEAGLAELSLTSPCSSAKIPGFQHWVTGLLWFQWVVRSPGDQAVHAVSVYHQP